MINKDVVRLQEAYERVRNEDLISNIINTIRDNPPKEITHSL